MQPGPGLRWERVNFLLSSWYRAGFWIQYEDSVDNTPMFRLMPVVFTLNQ